MKNVTPIQAKKVAALESQGFEVERITPVGQEVIVSLRKKPVGYVGPTVRYVGPPTKHVEVDSKGNVSQNMKKSDIKEFIREIIKEEEVPAASSPAPQQQFTSFEEGMKKYQLSDPPLKKQTREMLDFMKSGLRIPNGTDIEIRFSKTHPSNAFFFYDGRWRVLSVQTLWKKVSGIGKPPSPNTMMKWDMDGVAKSVLGRKVEPDGWDQNGSPSWILAMGLI